MSVCLSAYCIATSVLIVHFEVSAQKHVYAPRYCTLYTERQPVSKVPDYGLYDRVLILDCAGSKAQSVSYPMAIKGFFLRVKSANDFDPVTELRMYGALLSLPHMSSLHGMNMTLATQDMEK